MIREILLECLEDLQTVADLRPSQVLVVGASTSEVIGKKIGTETSLDVGRIIVETVLDFVDAIGCDVAFQCCEHLNRALVVEPHVAGRLGLQRVTAIPVPGAGGAVAAVAWDKLSGGILVESISADAGIDIGDTLIGMHLKRVAVPVRGRHREIGQAHVTMAFSRPPLIGGVRAVYDREEAFRRIRG